MRILAVVMLLLSGGCTRYQYDLGEGLTERGNGLYAGAPLADVLVELGPPIRVSPVAGGYVLAWEHWEVTEDKLGFSLSFAGAEAMSVDWGAARAAGEFLLLGFDRQHTLVDFAWSDWDGSAGGGRSIQPMGGFVSVVDVDDLVERLPQHRWGAGSLEKLRRSLNRENHPDTGGAVLEQRGTPTGIGQRALEMD